MAREKFPKTMNTCIYLSMFKNLDLDFKIFRHANSNLAFN